MSKPKTRPVTAPGPIPPPPIFLTGLPTYMCSNSLRPVPFTARASMAASSVCTNYYRHLVIREDATLLVDPRSTTHVADATQRTNDTVAQLIDRIEDIGTNSRQCTPQKAAGLLFSPLSLDSKNSFRRQKELNPSDLLIAPRLMRLPDTIAQFVACDIGSDDGRKKTPNDTTPNDGRTKTKTTTPRKADDTSPPPQPRSTARPRIPFHIGADNFDVPRGLTKTAKHDYVVDLRISHCMSDKEVYRAAIRKGKAAQREQQHRQPDWQSIRDRFRIFRHGIRPAIPFEYCSAMRKPLCPTNGARRLTSPRSRAP